MLYFTSQSVFLFFLIFVFKLTILMWNTAIKPFIITQTNTFIKSIIKICSSEFTLTFYLIDQIVFYFFIQSNH